VSVERFGRAFVSLNSDGVGLVPLSLGSGYPPTMVVVTPELPNTGDTFSVGVVEGTINYLGFQIRATGLSGQDVGNTTVRVWYHLYQPEPWLSQPFWLTANPTDDPLTVVAGANSYGDYPNAEFIWDMGDGQVLSGSPSVMHQYAQPGTYFITLVIKNFAGRSLHDTVSVEVS